MKHVACLSRHSANCPTCGTTFHNLPLTGGDAGEVYAALEMQPCGHCGEALCACCEQFDCDACDQTFCAEHLTLVEDGTPKPLRCCPACAAEAEPLTLPACAYCDQPVSGAMVSRYHLTWHTACFNAEQAERDAMAEEYDDQPAEVEPIRKTPGRETRTPGARPQSA